VLTADQIEDVVAQVKDQLRAEPDVPLKVSNFKFEDDWLYVEVVPAKPGVRASDHADLMMKVEKAIRALGIDNLLLLPQIDDE